MNVLTLIGREIKTLILKELRSTLLFIIAGKTCGAEVLYVRGIIGITGIIHVTNSMNFMRG